VDVEVKRWRSADNGKKRKNHKEEQKKSKLFFFSNVWIENERGRRVRIYLAHMGEKLNNKTNKKNEFTSLQLYEAELHLSSISVEQCVKAKRRGCGRRDEDEM
jgi:hypothetical protein